MELRDVLRDLVSTTNGIDFDCISVTREDRGQGMRVYMEAYTSDKTLVMRAYTKEDVPAVSGKFGLGNIGFLQGIVHNGIYKSDSTEIKVQERNGTVKGLTFSADGNDIEYLVVAENYIPAQPRFNEQPYDVEVIPSAAKVQELKSFSSLFKSFSSLITPYTEGDDLYFFVGEKNKNNHNGKLQFSKTEGQLNRGYGYPIDRVFQALARVSNAESKTMGFTKTGMMNVTVDTGVAVYSIYISGS